MRFYPKPILTTTFIRQPLIRTIIIFIGICSKIIINRFKMLIKSFYVLFSFDIITIKKIETF